MDCKRIDEIVDRNFGHVNNEGMGFLETEIENTKRELKELFRGMRRQILRELNSQPAEEYRSIVNNTRVSPHNKNCF